MISVNQLEILQHFKSFLTESDLSAVSIKNYLSDIRRFFEWLSTQTKFTGRLTDVSSTSINAYLDHLHTQNTPLSTINRFLASNRRFLTFLKIEYRYEIATLSLESTKITDLGKLRQAASQQEKPTDHRLTSERLTALFKRYLEEDKKSPATIKNYLSDLNHFWSWIANLKISAETEPLFKSFTNQDNSFILSALLTENTLNRYSEYLTISHTSTSVLNRRLSTFKKFVKFALTKNLIGENPFKTTIDEIKSRLHFIPLAWFSRYSSPSVAKLSEEAKVKKTLWQRYHAIPIVPYFHLALLVLFTTAIGLFAYNQIIKQASPSLAFPTALTRPARQLSFQGRLTDSSDTPIATTTAVSFKIWNQLAGGTEGTCSSAGGENCLYKTGTCNVTPDQDGIFNTLIGDTVCGAEIPNNVFTENQNVYLEVLVGASTLTPRQQIATVGFALNSETLQGYPASASATANTVPVINNSGNMVIAAPSPIIQSTSGTFAIQGQALTLQTAATSNGNISLAPDGTGQVQLIGGTNTQDFLRITNANLTTGSLISGYVGNNTATGDLLRLSSGASETDRFTVRADGQVRTDTRNTLTDSAFIINQNGSGPILSASVSGSPKFIIDHGGKVGIGVTSPNYLLDTAGDINTSSVYRIGGSTVVSLGGGTQGIMIGVGAGVSSTGTVNTFVGYNSGNANTSGQLNTFVGGYAGTANTNGGGNAFFGYTAGYKNSGGGANTMIGAYTGYNNVSGNNNTYLGEQAGLNATGSNNVFLGFQAGYNETGDNKLYIANSSSNPPLLYGDFSTGRIGIGTTSPTALLDVNGTASIAGQLAIYGTPTIQSTAMQTLTLGGATTGNITLAPQNGATGAFIAPNTNGQVDLGTATNKFRNIYGILNPGFSQGSVIFAAADGSLTQDNNQFKWDDTNFRLGIGTNNPVANLDVRGSSGTAPIASISGATSQAALYIDNSVGDLITASSSGLNRFVVKQSGNVGIGTNLPAQLLDVRGHAIFGNQLSGNAASGTNTVMVNELSTATSGNVYNLQGSLEVNPAGASSSLFYGGYYDVDTLSGNAQNITGRLVGFQGQVDHNGSGTVAQARGFAGFISNNSTGTITNAYAGRFGNVNGNASGVIGSAYGVYINALSNSGTVNNNYGLYIENQSTGSTNYAIYSAGGTSYLAGKLGINALTPAAQLDVRGTSGTTPVASISGTTSFASLVVDNSGTGDIFAASSSGLNRLVITQNGNVGIGTSTPRSKVELAGTQRFFGGTPSNVGHGEAAFSLSSGYSTPVAGRLIFGDNSGWKFSIARNSAASPFDLVTFTDSGSVGIGTTTPTALLDVNGTASVAGQLALYTTPIIQSTAMQTLTIGGATTGNITLAPQNGAVGAFVAPNTDNQVDLGTATNKFRNVYGNINPGFTNGSVIFATSSGALAQNNSSFFWDDVNLRLGIGTTAPSEKVGIFNAGRSFVTIGTSTNGETGLTLTHPGDTAILSFVDAAGQTLSTSVANEFIINNRSGSIVLSADASFTRKDLYVDAATGDVGINDSTPTEGRLVVGGRTYTTDFTMTNGAGAGYVLTSDGSGNAAWTNTATGGTFGGWTLTGSKLYPNQNYYNVLIGSTNTADAIGKLTVSGFATGSALLVLNETGDQNLISASASGITKFVLTRTGQIGLGTSSPLATLDIRSANGTSPIASISGTSAAPGLLVDNTIGDLITASSSGLNRFVVKQSGSVGIGTNLPGAKLHVAAGDILLDNTQKIYFTGNTGFAGWIGNATTGSVGDVLTINGRLGGTAITTTGSAVSVFVTDASLVGIGGVTAPGGRLDVKGPSGTSSVNTILRNSGNIATLTVRDTNGTSNWSNDYSSGLIQIMGDPTNGFTQSTGNALALNINPTINQTGSAGYTALNIAAKETGLGSGLNYLINASASATGNTQEFFVKNDGSGFFNGTLGVGTTTPTAKLDVNGTASIAGQIALYTTPTIQSTAMQTLILGGATTGNISLAPQNGAANSAVIPSTNNQVNLGTTANSWARTTTNNFTMINGAGVGYILTSDASGNASWTPAGSVGAGPWTQTGITLYPSQNYYKVLIGSTNTTDAIGKLTVNGFATGSALLVLNETGDQNIIAASASGVTKFVLTRTGQIGLNTSSPLAALDVRGQSGTTPVASISGNTAMAAMVIDNSTGDLFTASSSGLNRFVIAQNGNVGIGTTSPTGSLEINGRYLILNDGTNSTIPTMSFRQGGVEKAAIVVGTGLASRMDLSVAGSNLITLNSSGIFGTTIGRTYAGTGGPADGLAVQGNVGIGTTSPTATLDVNGTASISGQLALYTTPTIQSTAMQTLTIGGATTGNISMAPQNGVTGAYVAPNTDNQVDLGIATNRWRNINAGGTVSANAFTCPDCLDYTEFKDTMAYDANLITNQTTFTSTQNFTGTTTTGFTYNANSLTSGTALALASTSTTLTSGSLATFNWSPTSATTASGDLVSISMGANGNTTGNLFNILNNGSSLFSVSPVALTSNLPSNFTSAGDVSIAYDINFTNPVSSFIKSAAPITIQSGEVFNSSDLTLRTFNAGDLVLDLGGGVTLSQAQAWTLAASTTALNFQAGLLDLDTTNSRVGIGTTTPTAKLDVNGTASISGQLALYGTPTIQSTAMQTLILGGATTGNITLAPQNGAVGGNISPSTNGQVDLGNTSFYYRNIYANNVIGVVGDGTQGYWQRATGALSPTTITDSINLGNAATASAFVHLAGKSGENSFINNANFGIGTIAPANRFYVLDSVDGANIVTNAAFERRDPNTPANNFGGALSMYLGRTDLNVASEAARINTIMPSVATNSADLVFSTLWNGAVHEGFRLKASGQLGVFTGTAGLNASAAIESNGSIMPHQNVAFDLGSPNTNAWNNLYASNIASSTGVVAIDLENSRIKAGDGAGFWHIEEKLDLCPTVTCPVATTTAVLVAQGGLGKIDVGTVDPPYTINGEQFATYMSGMVGVKEEVTGSVKTNIFDGDSYRTVVDFRNQTKASDLWLFSKVTALKTNIDAMSVLLTPSSSAKVWYEIDKANLALVIHSSMPTTISYRLTAPRFDANQWKNTNNGGSAGFNLVDPDQPTTLDSNGEIASLKNTPLFSEQSNGSYSLTSATGQLIQEVGSYASLFVANLQAGLVNAKNVIADAATIGSVTTNKLVSPIIDTDTINVHTKLTSPLADIDTLTSASISSDVVNSQTILADTATVSGTLFAANIESPSLDRLSSDVQGLTANYATASAILASLKDKYRSFDNLNSSASGLPSTNATISGEIALGNFDVANINSLMVNDSLISSSLNSISGMLYLQPTGESGINLLAGLMTLTPDGKVVINGDLTVTGNLFAQNISSQTSNVQRLLSSDATISGTLALGTPIATDAAGFDKLLAIYDKQGQVIGSIDASGSARLQDVAANNLVTEGLVIAAPASDSAAATASATPQSNATIGIATLPAYTNEIFIPNNKVDTNTLIYLTPISDTENQVLYLKSKDEHNGFTVAINQAIRTDIKFNYWLIKTK